MLDSDFDPKFFDTISNKQQSLVPSADVSYEIGESYVDNVYLGVDPTCVQNLPKGHVQGQDNFTND